MSDDEKNLVARWQSVRHNVDQAARDAGREPGDVTLVAVSKLHPAESIRILARAGQRDFGENYLQETLGKQDELQDEQINWHFIDHLQSNKAKYVPGRLHMLHTVDKPKLAQTLHNKISAASAPRLDVLVQVNLAREEQKCGIEEEALPALAETVAGLECLRLRGLMLMPPVCAPGRAAVFFDRLRELRDDLGRRLGMDLPVLSMGMSSDYRQAVASGATHLRVGTDIFGPRPPK